MNKRISPILIGLLVLALTGTAVYAGFEHTQKNEYQLYLQNAFQESFYETTKYVDDVRNILSKLRLTSKPEQSAPLFARLWGQAAAAQENLGRLPYNHSVIDSSQKFLSQTSDFAYSMMNKNIDGSNLTEDDISKLDSLYEYSIKFSNELNTMASEVSMGNNISWSKISEEEAVLEKAENDAEQNIPLLGSMSKVNEEFQEYPSLIYDGPFSDHLKTLEPLMTKGAQKITSDDGIQIVKDFLNYSNVKEVKFIGKTDEKSESVLPLYSYQALLGDSQEPSVYIDITQYGGYPLLMLNYTDTSSEAQNNNEITLEEAKQRAKEFLNSNKYENMEPSYYEQALGVAVINFAPVENGITMYPDLIKVKVDLKNGDIIGFEGKGYIMMHHQRELSKPKISEEEAKQQISPNFNIEASKLCVIPLESKKEVLCYEFKGKYNDDNFLVYINADTGKQEKILQLLISDNAILTE